MKARTGGSDDLRAPLPPVLDNDRGRVRAEAQRGETVQGVPPLGSGCAEKDERDRKVPCPAREIVKPADHGVVEQS